LLIDNLLDFSEKALKYRLILKKPTYEELCCLEEAFNIEYTGSLGSLNKLSFSLPFMLDGKRNINIDKIQSNYLIYCELYEETTGLVYQQEYFLINNIENVGDEKDIKQVSCIALQYQLATKLIKNYSGSKKLYRAPAELAAYSPSEEFPTFESFRESGILNTVSRLAMSWTIGNIPAEINDTFRDFDIDCTSVISFLLDTVQESFGIIFEFDTVEKTISGKSIDSLGTFRGFLLSDSSYIKSIIETINSEDITTKLFVYGKDDLNIRAKNMGEEYLLDLSYFRNRNFMSQNLLDALDSWDDLILANKPTFESLTANLTDKTNQLANKSVALVALQEELKLLEKEQDRLISEEEDLTDINSQIDAKDAQIETVESEISVLETDIAETENDLEELQLLVLMGSNLTALQIAELDFFIHEKELRIDSITDIEELYQFGLKAIQKVNQPVVQFDLDTISLFDCVECQLDWDKLKLGDIAFIKYDLYNINIELRIIAYTHSSESNRLSVSFGNSRDINNANMLYDELTTSISTNTTLDYNKNRFLDYVNSGDKSKINQYITNALDLSKQGAVAASNQSVSIDQRGITLTNPANPDYQVKMINDLVVFTRDGWQTASIALSADRGVVAESVMGQLGAFCTVRADQIVVGDYGEGLSEEVLGDKVVLQNTEYNRVTINTDEGIKALHPADGSYSTMNGAGFLRYVPNYTYTEQPLPANSINFTGKTIGGLELLGWEFNGTTVIENNCLKLLTSAMIYQHITKNNATFTMTYYTAPYTGDGDDDPHYTGSIRIDNDVYTLDSSTAGEDKTITLTINKGYSYFGISSGSSDSQYGDIVFVRSITFESNPVNYIDPNVSSMIGTTYQFRTYINEGTTRGRYGYITRIQLPDDFKGKDFVINVFLKDTGENSDTGYTISSINLNILTDYDDYETDYENAIIRVRAEMKCRANKAYPIMNMIDTGDYHYEYVMTDIGNNYYSMTQGFDFMYIAQY
jgi:hypothetical protein